MPWTASSAHGKTHAANTKGKKRKWAAIANAVRRRTGSDADAIRIANSQMHHKLFNDVMKDATAQSVHMRTAIGNERKQQSFEEVMARTSVHTSMKEPEEHALDEEGKEYDDGVHGSNLEKCHSKECASYTAHARNFQCRTCTMFEEPSSCSIVAGRISPEGHCKYFEAKPGALTNGEDGMFKSFSDVPFTVMKSVPDQQLMFGWASVVEKDGQLVIDKQGDIIPVSELESAAYDFTLNSRDGGDMHRQMGVSRLVESMVFTKDKQDALGIDLGQVGWWVGFKVDDAELWAAHKRGERPEFSIGGQAIPVEID